MSPHLLPEGLTPHPINCRIMEPCRTHSVLPGRLLQNSSSTPLAHGSGQCAPVVETVSASPLSQLLGVPGLPAAQDGKGSHDRRRAMS